MTGRTALVIKDLLRIFDYWNKSFGIPPRNPNHWPDLSKSSTKWGIEHFSINSLAMVFFFPSFLPGRRLSVVVGSHSSSFQETNTGVLQGAPTDYLLHIKDLLSSSIQFRKSSSNFETDNSLRQFTRLSQMIITVMSAVSQKLNWCFPLDEELTYFGELRLFSFCCLAQTYNCYCNFCRQKSWIFVSRSKIPHLSESICPQ